MIGEVIGGAEDRQCAVAEELVDMPTGIDDGGHDNPKQGEDGRQARLPG